MPGEVLKSMTISWPKEWEVKQKPLLIYIAAPLTIGDPSQNIRRACFVGDAILELGHIPFIPHLSHFWDLISPKSYETYMDIDFEMLARCDGLLRIEGHSLGADREVAEAKRLGIPVYYSIEELP